MDHIQGTVFLFHVLLSEPFNRPLGTNEVFGLIMAVFCDEKYLVTYVYLMQKSGKLEGNYHPLSYSSEGQGRSEAFLSPDATNIFINSGC